MNKYNRETTVCFCLADPPCEVQFKHIALFFIFISVDFFADPN